MKKSFALILYTLVYSISYCQFDSTENYLKSNYEHYVGQILIYNPSHIKLGFDNEKFESTENKIFKALDSFIVTNINYTDGSLALRRYKSLDMIRMSDSSIFTYTFPEKFGPVELEKYNFPFLVLGFLEKHKSKFISSCPDSIKPECACTYQFLSIQLSPDSIIEFGYMINSKYKIIEPKIIEPGYSYQKGSGLCKKFGSANFTLIVHGKVKIGFTKEMAILSWGEPQKINKTTTQYGSHEQWVYPENYLYFENGKLTSIQ